MQTKHQDYFVPATNLIKKIKQKMTLTKKEMSLDSTSFNYITTDGAEIGFIVSESQPFVQIILDCDSLAQEN